MKFNPFVLACSLFLAANTGAEGAGSGSATPSLDAAAGGTPTPAPATPATPAAPAGKPIIAPTPPAPSTLAEAAKAGGIGAVTPPAPKPEESGKPPAQATPAQEQTAQEKNPTRVIGSPFATGPAKVGMIRIRIVKLGVYFRNGLSKVGDEVEVFEKEGREAIETGYAEAVGEVEQIDADKIAEQHAKSDPAHVG